MLPLYYVAIAVIVIYIFYTLFIENDDHDRLKPVFEDVDRPYDRNVIDGQYPKGWYIVCASDELPMGGVKPFSICGQEYLVFRGYSGVPSVLTAYCPHLGANIGIGGVVTSDESGDDCVQCPFHGWVFRGADGQCARIPNIDKADLKPLNAKVGPQPSAEVNGLIYMWHNTSGSDPDFYPEKLSKTYQMDLRLSRRFTVEIENSVKGISQDIVDGEHAYYVHGIKGFAAKFLGAQYVTEFVDSNHADDPYRKYKVRQTIMVKLFGRVVYNISMIIRMTGPSYIEFLFKFPFLPTLVAVYSHLPVSQTRTESSIRVFSGPGLASRLMANVYGMLLEEHLRKDVVMRSNLKSPEKPVLSSLDTKIAEYNQWFKTFYKH